MSNDFMERRDKLIIYPHREEDKRHYNKDWYRWRCRLWNHLWFSAKENSWFSTRWHKISTSSKSHKSSMPAAALNANHLSKSVR
jgi:hypothetical protein